MQEQFRRDQTKLQQLLGGRKTPVLAATRAVNLQKYDPHTASLIRNGLIVPKWNLSEELPEHLGAPGIVSDSLHAYTVNPLASINTIKSDPLFVIEARLLFETQLVLVHPHYSKLMAGNM